jgi:hypothetical protein
MSLNLANNSLGELVLPKGWTKTGDGGMWDPFVFKHAVMAESRKKTLDPNQRVLSPLPVSSLIWGR